MCCHYTTGPRPSGCLGSRRIVVLVSGMQPLRPQRFDIRAGECRELMATYSLHIQLRYALQYNGVELENGSRSVADPALTCRAIVIPPLNGAGVVRESVCRRDKRASAKMRKGGILKLGKADSSRLKPVRNDKGEIEWLSHMLNRSAGGAAPPKSSRGRGRPRHT